MNSMKCVLAVALGAGLALFATGCVVDATSGEGDTNAADVSPAEGTRGEAFHKVPPGQGDPQPGNPGVYPWPSPWYNPTGNVPSADMTNVQVQSGDVSPTADQTGNNGDPQAHRGSDVGRTPTSSNEPNAAEPGPNTLKRKP